MTCIIGPYRCTYMVYRIHIHLKVEYEMHQTVDHEHKSPVDFECDLSPTEGP